MQRQVLFTVLLLIPTLYTPTVANEVMPAGSFEQFRDVQERELLELRFGEARDDSTPVPDITDPAITGDPAVSPNTDDPSVSPITGDPAVSPNTDSPSVSPITGDPAVSPNTDNPSVSPITGGPSVSPNTDNPSASPITADPAVSPNTGNPSASPNTDSGPTTSSASSSATSPVAETTVSAAATTTTTAAPTTTASSPVTVLTVMTSQTPAEIEQTLESQFPTLFPIFCTDPLYASSCRPYLGFSARLASATNCTYNAIVLHSTTVNSAGLQTLITVMQSSCYGFVDDIPTSLLVPFFSSTANNFTGIQITAATPAVVPTVVPPTTAPPSTVTPATIIDEGYLIATIVLACVLGVVLLLIVVYVLCFYRKKKEVMSLQEPTKSNTYEKTHVAVPMPIQSAPATANKHAVHNSAYEEDDVEATPL